MDLQGPLWSLRNKGIDNRNNNTIIVNAIIKNKHNNKILKIIYNHSYTANNINKIDILITLSSNNIIILYTVNSCVHVCVCVCACVCVYVLCVCVSVCVCVGCEPKTKALRIQKPD